jgi:ribosomal protein S25
MTRPLSAAVFGNEKVVEVVLALENESRAATTKQLSQRTGIDHSMVRAVLLRLADAGVLRPLPRAHARGALYYEVAAPAVWERLLALARALLDSQSSSRSSR